MTLEAIERTPPERPSFERAKNLAICKRCRKSEWDHVWACSYCGAELPMGLCGCGAHPMAKRTCCGTATLKCPG